MGISASKVRLALDHNFPAPVLKAFGVMIPHVELVPIAEIEQQLAEVDDWECLLRCTDTSSDGMASSRTTRRSSLYQRR